VRAAPADYIWTDIFFGDMSYGRMNQFVPQLILGNALDGSSGAPAYKPKWGEHKTCAPQRSAGI
jgi:hypothetical protein